MTLKQALANKVPVLGTFLKTPHFQIAEVLSMSPLDVLCLDAEHAPYSRTDIDTNILACRSHQMPVLIRVHDDAPHTLLNALDLGATGIVVPHVKSAVQLQRIVKHCYFGPEGRGYAGSTRAAGYTTKGIAENIATNRSETVVIAQIEDAIALEDLDALCQVEGCDCLFIGRVDLTLSLGEQNINAPRVIAAVEKIVATANYHKKTIGMFIGNLDELPTWLDKGVSLFLLGSDHQFLLQGAKSLRQQFSQAIAAQRLPGSNDSR